MHVLYVIDSLVPAGAERSLADLAPRYTRSGMKLDVAYLDPRQGLQAELSRAGARLFPADGVTGRLGRVRWLRRLMAERRPDLVHTTLFESDIAGRTAGTLVRIPVVSSLVNTSYGPEHLGDPGLRRWKVRAGQAIDALTCRRVVRFHAITREVARVMGERLRIPHRRIDVIPRGRDPERLGRRTPERRRHARRSLGISEDEPLVLAAARHEYQKGLDVLLRSFVDVVRRLPNAQLRIAGREGNETKRLHAMTEQLRLGDQASFLGPRHDLPDLVTAADLFCLPSRWEGFGGVLLEAMALEAPIVATDLAPVREVVSDEHAALVAPGDSGELTTAIVSTLLDPDEAGRRVQRARDRFVSRFTIDTIAEQMIAFYERALGHRSGTSFRD